MEPETPGGQYAKREYYIRLIGQVPVNVVYADSDADTVIQGESTTDDPESFEPEGTPLASIDVTMSHVAVMYAAGRLLDSIRDPFNASIIRAEMGLLRDREETKISPEDYEKWKQESHEAKCLDSLVSEAVPDPKLACASVPQCPYLCQLLFKSFSVGVKPGFWCGAREMVHENGSDGLRNVRGRAGADVLTMQDVQIWFLYIDVSDPLRPRYAFMDERNIIDSTQLGPNLNREPLYIFNAREHAYQLMIPESEVYSNAEQFGEQKWDRHTEGVKPTAHRQLTKLPDDPNLDPDYRALLLSRMKRAQEHPAVIRMEAFGWLTAEDVFKPDGSALLQGIWRNSLNISSSRSHNLVIGSLLDAVAKGIVVIRSQAMNEPDHPKSPELEFAFAGLLELPEEPDLSLKSMASRAVMPALPNAPGGMLSLLNDLKGPEVLAYLKLRLAQNLKKLSSKGGAGFQEEALKWLAARNSEPEVQPCEDSDAWLELDYDTTEPSEVDARKVYDEEAWWIQLYQALCYRAAVAQERLSRSTLTKTSQNEAAPAETINDLTSLISFGEFPGRVLGDVAHPSFDVSYFSRISETQLLSALEIWANSIWLPDLDQDDWNFDHSTPIPLRTLNVSGCHFVTRNTIRQALQIAPSITRIIMIGCQSFTTTDLMLLSLDGTLNNVDCILTSDTTRDPFRNPRHKKQARDDAYNQARALLPRPPNQKIQANMDSVPGVFFNSTEEFMFKYTRNIYDTYYSKGLSSRSLSHSLVRPPALGFDPETGKAVCGPPRFSIILATHTIHDTPVTGATLPRVPIDTGIEGIGTNGSGLTSIWRGIIDLLELLGDPYIRNKQRWNLIRWSLVVKSCFSGPGQKWGKKSGLEGGGEFYGFPAYFKGGPGQANEEWIFAYQFRDVVARIQTYWANGSTMDPLVYPQSSTQDCWAFIRYGRDANPLSHQIPTMVLYNVREFRQAICPDIPILEDEARWMARVEDLLTNGTWHPSYPIVNWGMDRRMAQDGDPTWARMRESAGRMMKPKYMKEIPHELMLLVERMMTCQMNAGSDPF